MVAKCEIQLGKLQRPYFQKEEVDDEKKKHSEIDFGGPPTGKRYNKKNMVDVNFDSTPMLAYLFEYVEFLCGLTTD